MNSPLMRRLVILTALTLACSATLAWAQAGTPDVGNSTSPAAPACVLSLTPSLQTPLPSGSFLVGPRFPMVVSTAWGVTVLRAPVPLAGPSVAATRPKGLVLSVTRGRAGRTGGR